MAYPTRRGKTRAVKPVDPMQLQHQFHARRGKPMTKLQELSLDVRTFASDVKQGFAEIIHNSIALIGIAVLFAAVAFTAWPEFRQSGEVQLIGWLQNRQIALNGIEVQADAIDRATAANPQDLPKQQAAVAYWLSKKYRVAPEPLSALVVEAYEIGNRTHLDPTLILAVMAVESSFNPFAQSHVGAQGLMQVMTRVHSDKYEVFGGELAAFDPLTNLRVGAKVLMECIHRSGSVRSGLVSYVGAANLADDGGYADKVLAEHARIKQVALGRSVPFQTTLATPTATPVKTSSANSILPRPVWS
jgi:hypothetical protein